MTTKHQQQENVMYIKGERLILRHITRAENVNKWGGKWQIYFLLQKMRDKFESEMFLAFFVFAIGAHVRLLPVTWKHVKINLSPLAFFY